MPNKLPPYPAPEVFRQFISLVKRAKTHQHGSITKKQFSRLLNIIMSAQERVSPLIAWCHWNEKRLRQSLLSAGITIRKDKIPNPSRFKTKERGLNRLASIEKKIQKRRKR